MLKTMARRVRHFAGIVSDLAFHPVTERVARYLDTAVAGPVPRGTRIDLALTHTQLAARLGTVRELVARAFAQLERSGVTEGAHHQLHYLAMARGDAVTGHTH